MQGSIDIIKRHAQERNPNADIYLTNSIVSVAEPDVIKGKKVVTIDDGPTLTHGEMPYGAGGSPVPQLPWHLQCNAVGAAV